MTAESYRAISDEICKDLRLKTHPVAVNFFEGTAEFPEKTRRPSTDMKKRITLGQAVTLARVYGWSLGVGQEDLVCVSAMIAFGFGVDRPQAHLPGLFCEIELSRDAAAAEKEVAAMSLGRPSEKTFGAILFSPLHKATLHPDVVTLYGNPAQVMRMVQALVYAGGGDRIGGNFGGKVECSEYLLAPFFSGKPRVAIPGIGDRIFSMTQDDEMALAMPGKDLPRLLEGLGKSGKCHRRPISGDLLPELRAPVSQCPCESWEKIGTFLKTTTS